MKASNRHAPDYITGCLQKLTKSYMQHVAIEQNCLLYK